MKRSLSGATARGVLLSLTRLVTGVVRIKVWRLHSGSKGSGSTLSYSSST